MLLQGLPDFQKKVAIDKFVLFSPYGGVGSFSLLPDSLALAERPDGSPDLMLNLVRGDDPSQPPEPHGILEVKINPRYRIDEALSALRKNWPAATLQPAIFSSGFLYLQTLDSGSHDSVELSEELKEPIRMLWNGLDSSRSILKLSLNSAEMFKGSLQGNLTTLYASADLELAGVSPRLPLRVSFDPGELLKAVGCRGGLLSRESLVDFFRRDPGSISAIDIQGILLGINPEDFAQAMADRLRGRFGEFLPSPVSGDGPYLRLASPEGLEDGKFTWDLSEPFLAERACRLSVDSFDAVSRWVKGHGLDKIYNQSSIPSFNTGYLFVRAMASLPQPRVGVLDIGITMKAQPWPPYRPQSIVKSIELSAPQDSGHEILKFSPREKPGYTCSTFAVISLSQGELRREMEGMNDGEIVRMVPGDLPIEFVAVEAYRELLDTASVKGICRISDGGPEVDFELNSDCPTVAVAVPRDAEGMAVDVVAVSKDGSGSLMTSIKPALARNVLGPSSFPGWGYHKVDIQCDFCDGQRLFVLQVLPQGLPEGEAKLLSFTPEAPKKEWSWFSDSPFHSGYRFREYRGSIASPGAWSEVIPASQSLRLKVDAAGGIIK